MSEGERRVGVNEAVFREVNERLRELNAAFTTPSERIDVICECADAACTVQLSMVPAEYEALRAHARRFVVAPGHERGPDVERVVERRDGYHVVEKRGAAGDEAARADPRTSA